jgi:hypothetical protein
MQDSAYSVETVAGLFFLIVGVRLLLLSFRTGGTPERLLGAGLLVMGFSYLLYNLPFAFADDLPFGPFYLAARLLTCTSAIAFALFTWIVFRRRDTWGLWVIAGTLVCMSAGLAGSAWVGDWEGIDPLRNPWWWAEWVALTATEAWMGAEAFVHYGSARQRVRLGLCDPLVCNRFLLWGLAASLWLVVQFTVIAQNIEYQLAHQWSPFMDTLVGITEMISIAMIWLAFFPPRFYRRWVRGATPAAKAVET